MFDLDIDGPQKEMKSLCKTTAVQGVCNGQTKMELLSCDKYQLIQGMWGPDSTPNHIFTQCTDDIAPILANIGLSQISVGT